MFIMTMPVGGLAVVTGGTSRKVASDRRETADPEASSDRDINELELRMLILCNEF